MSDDVEVAVIGGTGFYEMEGLQDVRHQSIDTPYGAASDEITIGTLAGVRVAFLARHGAGHRLLPSELPQRANFWALAALGVRRVIAVSAVGSLREEMAPRHMVVPDQLVDNTKGHRPSTFFGEGVVAHISFANPFCRDLSTSLLQAGRGAQATMHDSGTLVVIDGPAFSTKAESLRYRSWGASVIGMTASPEAKLAREAGMCYAPLACVTDYDTWHPDHESVTVAQVIENLQANTDTAKRIVDAVIRSGEAGAPCLVCAAQRQALLTAAQAIPEARRRELAPILSRYGI